MKGKILQVAKEEFGLTTLAIEFFVDKLEPLINQEVEKRIKERMPSEEESKKEADELFEGTNREFRKGMYSGFLFGIQWLRSRLTNQKKEDNNGSAN